MTKTVVDGLVQQQGVEHVGAGAQTRGQTGGDRLGSATAHVAVGMGQHRQTLLKTHRAISAGQLHLDRRRQFVEQSDPCRSSRHRLLGKELFLGLAEQVGTVAAQVGQVMGTKGQALIGQQAFNVGVIGFGPFQLQKHRAGRQHRRALLHPGHEGTGVRVKRVPGQTKAHVRTHPTQGVIKVGQGGHEHHHGVHIQRGHRAAITLDGVHLGVGAVQQLVDGGPGQQRLDVPGH